MVPREITDEMINRFRRQITAFNSQNLTDAEIRTGLEAVFVYSIWGDNLPTEVDMDGWERQVSAQQALADAGQRVAAAGPSVLDTWYRALDLASRNGAHWSEDQLRERAARLFPILLNPSEIPQ